MEKNALSSYNCLFYKTSFFVYIGNIFPSVPISLLMKRNSISFQLILSFLCLIFFVSYLRKLFFYSEITNMSYYFVRLYLLPFHMKFYNPTGIQFSVWFELEVKLHYIRYEHLNTSAPFIEKPITSPSILSLFIKSQVHMCVNHFLGFLFYFVTFLYL